MFNLQPSPLEQEIYASVVGIINEHVKDCDNSGKIYEEVQRVLECVRDEISAQHSFVLHLQREVEKINLRRETDV